MPSTLATWTGLIDKTVDDPAVQAAQLEFGFTRGGAQTSDGVGDQPVRRAGVSIFYESGGGEVRVSDIQFRAKGFEGHDPYDGDLPNGILFSDDRAQVEVKLGPPFYQPPVGNNLRWELGDRYITVDFNNDWSAIRRVTTGRSSAAHAGSLSKQQDTSNALRRLPDPPSG